jgi:hypothetical protein
VPPYNWDGGPFVITVRLASKAKAGANEPAAAAAKAPNTQVTARPIGGPQPPNRSGKLLIKFERRHRPDALSRELDQSSVGVQLASAEELPPRCLPQ